MNKLSVRRGEQDTTVHFYVKFQLHRSHFCPSASFRLIPLRLTFYACFRAVMVAAIIRNCPDRQLKYPVPTELRQININVSLSDVSSWYGISWATGSNLRKKIVLHILVTKRSFSTISICVNNQHERLAAPTHMCCVSLIFSAMVTKNGFIFLSKRLALYWMNDLM